MLVALALFALIGGAGYSVLGQMIAVQDRTAGRLERLGAIERTMQVVTQDFLFTSGGSVAGTTASAALRRTAGNGEVRVRYVLEGSTLMRLVSSGLDASPVRQDLLSGVGAVEWRFFDGNAGWLTAWPPADATAGPVEPVNPAAVSMDLRLTGPGLSGIVRRVALLPTAAKSDPGA
jgi:general secretion pathway protein J